MDCPRAEVAPYLWVKTSSGKRLAVSEEVAELEGYIEMF